MTVAAIDFPLQEPSARELMARALEPHILIGMPHLNPHGLSETWLMKELGHRHWLMLALHLGMENADFRTPDGEEAYAAISATALSEARFDDVRANDVLTIRSVLTPVSRTQVSTRHRLSVRGSHIGTVELISAFVHRSVSGDNHSIARIAIRDRFPKGLEENQLASAAAAIRNGHLDTYFGLPTAREKVLRALRYEPDLSQEFNGAGLFYFAEFQALANRAFDRWFPLITSPYTVRRRDVFFSGNIRPGETLMVELMEIDLSTRSACCCIRRSDGKPIGSIFTSWA
jgi:probable biosynthetic protein (TIGR04099 family)